MNNFITVIIRYLTVRRCGRAAVLLFSRAAVLSFLLSALMMGCADDRTPPAAPELPSYSETIVLLNRAEAAGTAKEGAFTLRGEIESARLYIYGFLKPDPDLERFEGLGAEIDSIEGVILNLDGIILELQRIRDKTPADSAALDSLNRLRQGEENQIAARETRRDSLDTFLDDRFKVSVWLDDDAAELYPQSIFLDSSSVPYIPAGQDVVWGQGFYLMPTDTSGWRGKRMTLELTQYWIADADYRHPHKPARPDNYLSLPELYPVSDWISRLNEGRNHRIYFRFGAAETTTEITATLAVIYKTAG